MKRETILLVRNPKISSSSIVVAAEATGYRIVSTSSTQAIALAFIMRCVAAVLLDLGNEEVTFELARKARAICSDAPIILLSPEPVEHVPSFVDATVSTRMPPRALAAELSRVVSVARSRRLGSSLRQAS